MLLDWFFICLTKSCEETFQMKSLLVVLFLYFIKLNLYFVKFYVGQEVINNCTF